MCTIHLSMMELERNRKVIPEESFPISAPEQKGIVINTTVHADNAVQLSIYYGGGTNHHAVFRQISVLYRFSCYAGIVEIVTVKDLKIIGIENITGTDFPGLILYNYIDRQLVILHQLISNRQ